MRATLWPCGQGVLLLWAEYSISKKAILHYSIKSDMMKKLTLSLLMAFVCLSASAQFEAKKTYVNASLSGLNLAYSKNTRVTADIQTTAGYFLDKDVLLFGRLGYSHPGKEMDNFELGLGTRYYIEQNGLSLGLAFSYEHGHIGEVNEDHWYITPELGYTFFLNNYIAVEPALYYKMSFDNFADASTVGLKVGLAIYF